MPEPMLQIDTDIPAGNLRVLAIEGRAAQVAADLRDTAIPWFYWKFRACFPAAGEYQFSFPESPALGPRGPAVSFDEGTSWNWLGADAIISHEPDRFVFRARQPGAIWFCLGIPYLSDDLAAFLRQQAGNPHLTVSELCRSRQGRRVELLTAGADSPADKPVILLTARHHACEMMASYALEGAIEAAAGSDAFGRRFRERFVLYAVPLVDRDGVENGDQGKGRTPHDHARDYGVASIYPEVRAIMELIGRDGPAFIFDLHCPWLRDGCNEYAYFVGPEEREQEARALKFGVLLEAASPLPFRAADLVRFGTDWNTAANYTGGRGLPLAGWARRHCSSLELALSLEIPYANVREVTLTPDLVRRFGRALLQALATYNSPSFPRHL